MTSEQTKKLKESMKADDLAMSDSFKKMFVAYRVAIQTMMSSIVGRVVGNRIDGTVPVYLG
jgi:hypothetical protein